MAEPKTPLLKNTPEIYAQIQKMTKEELDEEICTLDEILDTAKPNDFIWRSGIYDDLELRIEFMQELSANKK